MVNKYWSNEEVSPLSHVGSYIFSLDQDLLGADADWIAPWIEIELQILLSSTGHGPSTGNNIDTKFSPEQSS